MNNIVQIGCNIGNDHVFRLVSTYPYKWNLTFIDALDTCICECHNFYSREELSKNWNMQFHNLAIVDDDRKSAEIYYPEGSPLCGHASLIQHHTELHELYESNKRQDSPRPMLKKTVFATTFNKFFGDLGMYYIDRLYLDIEGYDARIISSIDFGKFFIPFIRFEHRHSDGPFTNGIILLTALQKLKANGYLVFQDGEYDLVACRKD